MFGSGRKKLESVSGPIYTGDQSDGAPAFPDDVAEDDSAKAKEKLESNLRLKVPPRKKNYGFESKSNVNSRSRSRSATPPAHSVGGASQRSNSSRGVNDDVSANGGEVPSLTLDGQSPGDKTDMFSFEVSDEGGDGKFDFKEDVAATSSVPKKVTGTSLSAAQFKTATTKSTPQRSATTTGVSTDTATKSVTGTATKSVSDSTPASTETGPPLRTSSNKVTQKKQSGPSLPPPRSRTPAATSPRQKMSVGATAAAGSAPADYSHKAAAVVESNTADTYDSSMANQEPLQQWAGGDNDFLPLSGHEYNATAPDNGNAVSFNGLFPATAVVNMTSNFQQLAPNNQTYNVADYNLQPSSAFPQQNAPFIQDGSSGNNLIPNLNVLPNGNQLGLLQQIDDIQHPGMEHAAFERQQQTIADIYNLRGLPPPALMDPAHSYQHSLSETIQQDYNAKQLVMQQQPPVYNNNTLQAVNSDFAYNTLDDANAPTIAESSSPKCKAKTKNSRENAQPKDGVIESKVVIPTHTQPDVTNSGSYIPDVSTLQGIEIDQQKNAVGGASYSPSEHAAAIKLEELRNSYRVHAMQMDVRRDMQEKHPRLEPYLKEADRRKNVGNDVRTIRGVGVGELLGEGMMKNGLLVGSAGNTTAAATANNTIDGMLDSVSDGLLMMEEEEMTTSEYLGRKGIFGVVSSSMSGSNLRSLLLSINKTEEELCREISQEVQLSSSENLKGYIDEFVKYIHINPYKQWVCVHGLKVILACQPQLFVDHFSTQHVKLIFDEHGSDDIAGDFMLMFLTYKEKFSETIDQQAKEVCTREVEAIAELCMERQGVATMEELQSDRIRDWIMCLWSHVSSTKPSQASLLRMLLCWIDNCDDTLEMKQSVFMMLYNELCSGYFTDVIILKGLFDRLSEETKPLVSPHIVLVILLLDSRNLTASMRHYFWSSFFEEVKYAVLWKLIFRCVFLPFEIPPYLDALANRFDPNGLHLYAFLSHYLEACITANGFNPPSNGVQNQSYTLEFAEDGSLYREQASPRITGDGLPKSVVTLLKDCLFDVLAVLLSPLNALDGLCALRYLILDGRHPLCRFPSLYPTFCSLARALEKHRFLWEAADIVTPDMQVQLNRLQQFFKLVSERQKERRAAERTRSLTIRQKVQEQGEMERRLMLSYYSGNVVDNSGAVVVARKDESGNQLSKVPPASFKLAISPQSSNIRKALTDGRESDLFSPDNAVLDVNNPFSDPSEFKTAQVVAHRNLASKIYDISGENNQLLHHLSRVRTQDGFPADSHHNHSRQSATVVTDANGGQQQFSFPNQQRSRIDALSTIRSVKSNVAEENVNDAFPLALSHDCPVGISGVSRNPFALVDFSGRRLQQGLSASNRLASSAAKAEKGSRKYQTPTNFYRRKKVNNPFTVNSSDELTDTELQQTNNTYFFNNNTPGSRVSPAGSGRSIFSSSAAVQPAFSRGIADVIASSGGGPSQPTSGTSKLVRNSIKPTIAAGNFNNNFDGSRVNSADTFGQGNNSISQQQLSSDMSYPATATFGFATQAEQNFIQSSDNLYNHNELYGGDAKNFTAFNNYSFDKNAGLQNDAVWKNGYSTSFPMDNNNFNNMAFYPGGFDNLTQHQPQTFQPSPVDTFWNDTHTTGLVNQGNTCYMNSSLQSLAVNNAF